MLTPRALFARRTASGGLRAGRHQRGLSLVELMVGITVGLFVTAAATVLVTGQLTENRQLLRETQLQQDLRATGDIVARELRRAGAELIVTPLIWTADKPNTAPVANALGGIDFASAGEVVRYRYQRAPGPTSVVPNDFGLRLSNQTIFSRAGTNVQALSDRNTVRITGFTVTREPAPAQQLACPRLCADGTQACWPTLQLFDLVFTITGESASVPASQVPVRRSVNGRVRVRNDALSFDPSLGGKVCP